MEWIPKRTIKHVYKDSLFFVSGQKKPYMYTQGQAVLNRSFFPCQDTPAVKAPYSANVKVRDTHFFPPIFPTHEWELLLLHLTFPQKN